MIKHIESGLDPWPYTAHSKRTMTSSARETIDTTRSILMKISGGNIIDFLSSTLTESEQIQLSRVRPIIQIAVRKRMFIEHREKKVVEMDMDNDSADNDATDESDGDININDKCKKIDYTKMNKTSLKKLCTENGLKRGGNRDVLIQRLSDPTNPSHRDGRKHRK